MILFGLPASFSVSEYANAERATDEDMARSAIEAAARTANPTIIKSIVAEAGRNLNDLASTPKEADEVVAATIVFGAGLSSDGIERFAQTNNFEIASAEAKIAVGKEGRIVTMSIGARDLLFLEGPLSERLRKNTGAQQYELEMLAQNSEPEQSDRLREAAHTPFPMYYKLDVIGQLGSVQRLLSDSSVAAVFLDMTKTKVGNYRAHQASSAQMKGNSPVVIRRRLSDGPPPGVTPDQILRTIPQFNVQEGEK